MITTDSFYKIFKTLPDELQTIVFQLAQNMEHTHNVSAKEIAYRRGFNIALAENNLSINKLAEAIQEKNGTTDIRDGLASLIENGYKGCSSIYLNDVCDYLNIDESFLIRNSEYVHEHENNFEWCFDTLSSNDKYAIYMLVLQLNSLNNGSYEMIKEILKQDEKSS